MTTTQNAYQANLINQARNEAEAYSRNRAAAETERSNLAREEETHRANRAQEEQAERNSKRQFWGNLVGSAISGVTGTLSGVGRIMGATRKGGSHDTSATTRTNYNYNYHYNREK